MSGLFAKVQSRELAPPGPPGTLVEEGDYVGWHLYRGPPSRNEQPDGAGSIVMWVILFPFLVLLTAALLTFAMIFLALLPLALMLILGNKVLIDLGLHRYANLQFKEIYFHDDGRIAIPLTNRSHHVFRFHELERFIIYYGKFRNFSIHINGNEYTTTLLATEGLAMFAERHGAPLKMVETFFQDN